MNLEEIDAFVKILSQGKEGQQNKSLEVQDASSSHLKIKDQEDLRSY